MFLRSKKQKHSEKMTHQRQKERETSDHRPTTISKMKTSSKSHLKHSSESSYACDPLCGPRLTFTHEKLHALVDTTSKIAAAVYIPVRAVYIQQWSLEKKKKQMVFYDCSALWVSIGNSDGPAWGRHMPNGPRLRAPNSSLIATYLFSNARHAELPLLASCTSCTLLLG